MSLFVRRVPVPGPATTESCAFLLCPPCPPAAAWFCGNTTPQLGSRAQPSRVCHLLWNLGTKLYPAAQGGAKGPSRSACPNLTALQPSFSPCVRNHASWCMRPETPCTNAKKSHFAICQRTELGGGSGHFQTHGTSGPEEPF